MIETQDLSKKLDKQLVLSNIDCRVNPGAVYGLLGSNGAGKSTLLNILAGIYKPTAGKAMFKGEPIYENNSAKSTIAYVSDDPFYFSQYTMTDMARYCLRVFPGFSMVKYEELSSHFPIDRNKKIHDFSKGMKRQVAIILALSRSPKVVLCDECFDGLDPVIRRLVKKIISEESAKTGMAIVLASHNLREIEDISTDIGILHEGKLLYQNSVNDIKNSIVKIRAVFDPMIDVTTVHNDRILSINSEGNIIDFILTGGQEENMALVQSYHPILINMLTPSLEEVFLYEMGENGYDFSKILL